MKIDDSLKIIYYALFHLHLYYGLLLWDNTSKLDSILVLQRKALRIIRSLGLTEPYTYVEVISKFIIV